MINYSDWSECWKSSPAWVTPDVVAPPQPAAADSDKELDKVRPAEISGQREVLDPSAGDPRQTVRTYTQRFKGLGVGYQTIDPITVTTHSRYGETASQSAVQTLTRNSRWGRTRTETRSVSVPRSGGYR